MPPLRRRRRSVIDWPVRRVLTVVATVANLSGVGVLLVLSVWVIPSGPIAEPGPVLVLNLVVLGGYLLLVAPLGVVWGNIPVRGRRSGGVAARQIVLHGPLRLVTAQTVVWLGAVGLLGALDATFSPRLALAVAATVLLGGITTCTLSYLLSERILRRTAARVLQGQPPRPAGLPGVTTRAVLFWALGTAVPVSGLMLTAVSALVFRDVPVERLAVIVLSIGGTALGAGLLVTVAAGRAVAEPVNAVRRALGRVEEGDFDVRVPVYDGTELGQLQAGFNRMAAGLRARERIRDLFGRQVGEEVAAPASDEVRLAGEVRRVAVLFVDVVDSTGLAAQRPPAEVVELLNRLFRIVVESVGEYGGRVNTFEGDAALVVFGAPLDAPDPAGSALAAGRRLAERLAVELPEVRVGIGVSAGDAVAGNVGDARRHEYAVIGDPVDEAARLTELAKEVPGGVLAAERAVASAREDEAARWELGEARLLRGRAEPTRLATPLAVTRAPGRP